MNYLSYFLIFNLVLLFIYSIIAYRFRTFRQVKFRFSGFLVVKMLIRFSLINLFIYLIIQFSSLNTHLSFSKISEFEAVLIVDPTINNSKATQDYSIYASQISPDFSSYKLYRYEKFENRLSLLIPKTTYLSFLTYLKNKDLQNIKTINSNQPRLESVFKNKDEGFYIQTNSGGWDQISMDSLSQSREYLGFNSNLDLYLLILLGFLLLSELFLSFQIIKY
jgi:hypothetical protein